MSGRIVPVKDRLILVAGKRDKFDEAMRFVNNLKDPKSLCHNNVFRIFMNDFFTNDICFDRKSIESTIDGTFTTDWINGGFVNLNLVRNPEWEVSNPHGNMRWLKTHGVETVLMFDLEGNILLSTTFEDAGINPASDDFMIKMYRLLKDAIDGVSVEAVTSVEEMVF